MPNLADPNYEPTDEELIQLAEQAFAPVRAANERRARESAERRKRIADARAKLVATLPAKNATLPAKKK